MPNPVFIVIPFHGSTDNIESLFSSLEASAKDLVDLQASFILINDSPGDAQLAIALSAATRELGALTPCRLIENPQRLGFAGSVNHGLRKAVAAGADVLLLDSDTEVFPGAVTEIQRVAFLDAMIGFVSPRSNNANICSFPHQPEFRGLRPADAHSVFCELSPHLPRFHYAPSACGFCIYIKLEILEEFGYLDEVCGPGYNEADDLIMRANRCGYRAAVANHAFVYHSAEPSFSLGQSSRSQSEERNAAVLAARYPEYIEHIQGYLNGAQYRAELLLRGLVKDAHGRYDIVFDFSHFAPYHAGTFEAAKQILIHAAREWKQAFNIHLVIEDEAARFHGLAGGIPGVLRVPPNSTAVFALAFRFGQPFQFEVVAKLSDLAVVNVYAMLDSIAWDCLHLNRGGLHELWQTVFSYADGVTYISEFVEKQFRSRFRLRPGLKEIVSYISLDKDDYPSAANDAQGSDYLLVIGNAFAHKRLPHTAEALSLAFPRQKIVALGFENVTNQSVLGYKSGQLSEDELSRLFADASAVIFPSLYEGFGIPVIRALSSHKPLFARSTPVNRELAERLGNPEDLILYNSTEELIRFLRNGVPHWKGSVKSVRGRYDWATLTGELGAFFKSLIDNICFSHVLMPRVEHVELLRLAGRAQPKERNLEPPASTQSLLEGVVIESYEQRIRELGERNLDLSRVSEEQRERILKIESGLEKMEGLIDDYKTRVRGYENRVKGYENRLADYENRVEDYENRAEDYRAEVKDLAILLHDRELRLRAVESSLSWMVTAPLRGLGSLWQKAFQRRAAKEN